MTDPRVTKLANVLVHYSLALKPSETFFISAPPEADELTVAVYAEAIRAGAHVDVVDFAPGIGRGHPALSEAFYRYASDEQLGHPSPVQKLLYDTYDAHLRILAPANTRYLTNVDPAKQATFARGSAGVGKAFMDRTAAGTFRWCLTAYPTQGAAQEASMSLEEYQDFVYGAGMLNEANPAAAWKKEVAQQRKLIAWLKGRDRVVMKGSDIDLTFSIKDRVFEECAGRVNFPDGEIFTGPVEESLNGWVRYRYPVIFHNNEVADAELWFENGRIGRETAGRGKDFLTATLNTDAGSRHIGEWGIGTNYNIQRATGNMLFDEKIGGTIHLAVGASYPQTGGKNESSIHFDMLCDMHDAEITIDGDLFYKNGRPVI